MKKQITKEKKTGKLSVALIDSFSEYAAKALEESNISKRDIFRFRYSIETTLVAWLNKIGEGAECAFEVSRRFGRIAITVSCKGEECNPQDDTQEEFGNLSNSSLLQTFGLAVGYSYENGTNKIKLMPGGGFVKQLAPLIIALISSVLFALLLKAFIPEFAVNLNTQFISPVFSTMMSALRTIASPLVFLAVLSGIYGIGDIAVLGTIGKKLLCRFILMTYVTMLVTLLIVFLMVGGDISTYTAESGAFGEILNLILQFIPTDIVSPFLNGNMLQIITISVACGIVMLILGDRVSGLCGISDQIYSVVQVMMEAVAKMVPVFVFISVFSLMLSNSGIELKGILQPIIGIVGTFVIMCLIVYPVILKCKYKISCKQLFKKLLPTFLIALSTASSAAAFAINVETCEKKLGVSGNVTKLGVPLGQVVFMPLVAAEYITMSIIMAKTWGVDVSILWIVTAYIVSGILSIAAPPIPGGSVSIYTILFLQLGIPDIALPVALGIDLVLDYVVTAGNIMCLQEEMIICADKTGYLREDVLLSE